MSLQGAIFDDLSFKDHKKSLDDNDSVVFLNPRESENGYFVETGWTSIGNVSNRTVLQARRGRRGWSTSSTAMGSPGEKTPLFCAIL